MVAFVCPITAEQRPASSFSLLRCSFAQRITIVTSISSLFSFTDSESGRKHGNVYKFQCIYLALLPFLLKRKSALVKSANAQVSISIFAMY